MQRSRHGDPRRSPAARCDRRTRGVDGCSFVPAGSAARPRAGAWRGLRCGRLPAKRRIERLSRGPTPVDEFVEQPSAADDREQPDVLAFARTSVLENGIGLPEAQILEILSLPDDRLPELLGLAHEVRLRWCGPDVEVEGIVSVKTGGCPEDCHFCSQSGQFASPVRAAWLDIPSLVRAAVETASTGATEFCIVAAVRGPDERLMAQMREGMAAIKAAVDINVAASLGILTAGQVEDLSDMGAHRYNHNLETSQSYFPHVVTTHSWEERWDTLVLVREAGLEVCCGGI